MRGARSTLILLIVFIALGAYVYLVELKRPTASDIPPNESLLNTSSEEISQLTIGIKDAKTVITRTDDGTAWQVTSPVETPADDAQISSLTSSLASLEIRRVIDDAAIDLAPFGLIEPVVEIAFILAGNTQEQRLLIGDSTPTGSERYAMLAGSSRVVLIASDLDATFEKSTFDLRDKAILRFDTSDIDQFQIESNGISIRLTKNADEWRLQEPWDVRADFNAVERAIGRLSTEQMRSVATESQPGTKTEEDASSDYGLSEPRLTVTIRLGSAAATLLIGDQAPDGTLYARNASRSIVFTIDSSLVTDLERAADEYREKDLFDFRPFNASWLKIEQSDTTVVFERAAAESEDSESLWAKVSPKSEDIDQNQMDDLLAKLSNLRAESFIESRAERGLDEATVVATVGVRFNAYGTEDGDKEERITLWRSGNTAYGVHASEAGAAVLNASTVDDALEALATVQSAEQ
jgi:hypothetical protein